MYKVFLAEDEILVREGIRNTIPWEKTTYNLAGEAADGETALSMIQEMKPDILITDIRMPFMDGLTLSKIIKKKLPWIKIIILSGHDEFEYARHAISIGVDEYLLKPVSSAELLKAMDKMAKRIDEEKEDILNITRTFGSDIKTKAVNSARGIKKPQPENMPDAGFDPASLLNIDGDIFYTKLKYAQKKDIDSIVNEYASMLENCWSNDSRNENNPMLIFFLFGEIIVSASKIAEPLGGNIKEIVPFSLNNKNIQEIAVSRSAFERKVKDLLYALIEFRDSRAEGRYQSVIVKAKEYIDNNFKSRDISLNALAEHVGISPNHLSAVFARETGNTFIEYLTKARIERAKLLLKTTNMKNADIAEETGFSDPHYFSYIFKKHTGLSPREFKNMEV